MGTRKAKVEARIEALCANHRFSTTVVYWKAVKILGRYRDIRYLSVMVTKDSEQITEGLRVFLKGDSKEPGQWTWMSCMFRQPDNTGNKRF